MNFNLYLMLNLLFWAGLMFLGLSVVLFYIHEVLRRKKDLDIFMLLMKDRNYPLNLKDKDIMSQVPVDLDDFNYCWLSIVFRRLTVKEENLANHAKWMGRCGGLALFLSFSALPALLTFLLAIVFANSFVGVYRRLISIIFEVRTFKKAWRLYKAQQND